MTDDARLKATFEMYEQRILNLKTEINRLRSLSENNARSWDAMVGERDKLRAEAALLTALADRLVAANSRLRAKVKELRKGYSHKTLRSYLAESKRLRAPYLAAAKRQTKARSGKL